ncbi:unnamed protein product [Moneuplotes crassus]|uniref:PIH1 N-terminal domain-containing protein n=2 Tax=Euplotes crassus TaxID=5936 RepID=A0AAD1UEB9_EUPCR|nr:unnamed protein product [Moneuplotes crassus]
MDFWNELHQATESVRTGENTNDVPPELSHLPEHVRQNLTAGSSSGPGGSMPTSGNSLNRDPAFRNLPEHLKNSPFANLSREELTALYEKMKKDPNAYKTPTQNIDKEMRDKAMKEGKPYIDPEGGCTIQPNKCFVIKSKDQNGQKMFVNMTSHELVDPPQEKHLPDSDQPAVRIPLSLGEIREDFDKKGDPCRVVDVIWNPEAAKKAMKEPLYKQGLVELAFEYIKQKYELTLDLKYTVPKLKYKGKTVQFQRVRAKKDPKIEQLDSKTLSEEEQKEIQERSYSKVKEHETVVKQKRPDWKLYCVSHDLKEQLYNDQWWKDQILLDKLDLIPDPTKEEEDEDEDQEMQNFMDERQLKTEPIEEYDGLNDGFAYFVIVANLDLLMRGHAIKIITQDRKINIDVPNLYSLTVNLPLVFDKSDSKAYFDCKRRILCIVLPLEGLNKKTEAEELVEINGDIAEEKDQPKEVSTQEISDLKVDSDMLLELV